MSICNIISIYSDLISFNGFFCYCIYNFFSICILRQICKFIFPVIICSYCLALNLLSICKKIYGNLCWSDSILIVCIFPGLASSNGYLFCCMVICNVITIYYCLITFYSFFFHCVCNFFSICIFRQVCEIVFPVVIFGYFLSSYYFIIGKKFYCNAIWTDSILIVIIIPGLASADFRCLRCMSICKSCCSIFGCFC